MRIRCGDTANTQATPVHTAHSWLVASYRGTSQNQNNTVIISIPPHHTAPRPKTSHAVEILRTIQTPRIHPSTSTTTSAAKTTLKIKVKGPPEHAPRRSATRTPCELCWKRSMVLNFRAFKRVWPHLYFGMYCGVFCSPTACVSMLRAIFDQQNTCCGSLWSLRALGASQGRHCSFVRFVWL